MRRTEVDPVLVEALVHETFGHEQPAASLLLQPNGCFEKFCSTQVARAFNQRAFTSAINPINSILRQRSSLLEWLVYLFPVVPVIIGILIAIKGDPDPFSGDMAKGIIIAGFGFCGGIFFSWGLLRLLVQKNMDEVQKKIAELNEQFDDIIVFRVSDGHSSQNCFFGLKPSFDYSNSLFITHRSLD